MKDELARLRDEIVLLEVIDSKHVGMDADLYLAVARSVRRTVERRLGRLTMRDFLMPTLPTLQTTAENIYFDGHGRLQTWTAAAMRFARNPWLRAC